MLIFNSKKVIFTEDRIINNKRSKIEINYNNIEKCWYPYPSIKSRIYIIINQSGGIIPGWLQIRDSSQRLHIIKLKPVAIEKLPKILISKIRFNKYNMYEWKT